MSYVKRKRDHTREKNISREKKLPKKKRRKEEYSNSPFEKKVWYGSHSFRHITSRSVKKPSLKK